MKLLKEYVFKSKKLLFFALGLALINQLFSLMDPQIMRILIDNYATQFTSFGDNEYIRGVGLWLLALIGVALVSRTAKAFQDYFVNVLTESVGTKIYADGVEHLFALSFSSFENERSGSILLNLEKARDDSKKFLTSIINDIFLGLISVTFVLVYSFVVHPYIGFTFVLLIPVVAITTLSLSKKIRSAQQKIVAQSADLAGSTTETIRNVGLIKSLGLEDQEVKRLNNLNQDVLQLELKKVVLLRTLTFIQGTLVNLVRVLILFVTLYLVSQELITLGEFTIFIFYTFYVFGPLYNLASVFSNYQQAKASNEELERILELPVSDYEKGSRKIKNIKSLAFENLSYSYQGAEEDAVHDISLDIKRSQTVAFVGPSGSGKSTLIKLLVGLYRPGSGELKINNQSVEDLDFKSYRSMIGYVSQDTQLFSGTIRDNLLFIKPEATDEDLENALAQAQAKNLLSRGDDETGRGLDAKIGETGIKLSGGEKQRLAIARALLRDPELLIFDEATSALDSLTEAEIVKTIAALRVSHPELIMVQVAHRLSTISSSDQLYVMQSGSVVEQGTHAELLDQDSLYRAMWRQQTN